MGIAGIVLLATYVGVWQLDAVACDFGEPGAWAQGNCTVRAVDVIRDQHCDKNNNCRDWWLVEVGVEHGQGTSATAYKFPSLAVAGRTRPQAEGWVNDESLANADA